MKKFSLDSKPLHPIQMGLFVLIELLSIFGETFSKFHVWGPLHLYDLSILVLGLFSILYFLKQKDKLWIWPVLIILFISLAYLFYSYFIDHNPSNYIIRQYALFVYLGLGYLIFSSYTAPNYQKYNIQFIVLIGVGAVIIQLLYFGYLLISSTNFSLFQNFNYFSKMAIMGVIVAGAYILIFIKNIVYKVILTLLYLLLSTTLGHASTFLAAFAIVTSYIIIRLPRKLKIIGLVLIGVSLTLFFVLLPQFSDQNAQWRLVFWKYSLLDILNNYYGIFGHGFGIPYASTEITDAMRDNVNSPWFSLRPEETYLAPMHNSFITMAFHIGLLPALLIFVPLIKAIQIAVFQDNSHRDKVFDFLFTAIIGLTVWASFNVILELPHSSIFYWLVYFTLIYHIKKTRTNEIQA